MIIFLSCITIKVAISWFTPWLRGFAFLSYTHIIFETHKNNKRAQNFNSSIYISQELISFLYSVARCSPPVPMPIQTTQPRPQGLLFFFQDGGCSNTENVLRAREKGNCFKCTWKETFQLISDPKRHFKKCPGWFYIAAYDEIQICSGLFDFPDPRSCVSTWRWLHQSFWLEFQSGVWEQVPVELEKGLSPRFSPPKEHEVSFKLRYAGPIAFGVLVLVFDWIIRIGNSSSASTKIRQKWRLFPRLWLVHGVIYKVMTSRQWIENHRALVVHWAAKMIRNLNSS